MRAIAAIALALLLAVVAGSAAEPQRVYLPMLATKRSDDPDLAALVALARGLTYPSESDFPFEPFAWDGEPGASTEICQAIAQQTGKPFELRSLDAFFARLVVAGPDATAEQRVTTERFRVLSAAIADRLSNTSVCRVGAIRIDVYLIGRSSAGTVVGLHTISIET